MTDLRNPTAKARDEWLESEEGKEVMEESILRSESQKQFLKNRLERAFLAGVKFGEQSDITNRRVSDG